MSSIVYVLTGKYLCLTKLYVLEGLLSNHLAESLTALR